MNKQNIGDDLPKKDKKELDNLFNKEDKYFQKIKN